MGIQIQDQYTSAELEAEQNAAQPSTFYAAASVWAAKSVSVAADRYKILSPADGAIKINGSTYYWETQQTLDLSQEATWDAVTTDYRVAANRAGKDFYIYACVPSSGSAPLFIVSANAEAPTGYTTSNSRQIAGFHCLCVAVDHATTLTAWAAGTVIALGCTRKAVAWDGYIYRCYARTGTFKTHATNQPDWASIDVNETIVDNEITWKKELHSLEGYSQGDIISTSVWSIEHRPSCDPKGMVYDAATGRWVDIYFQSGHGATTDNIYEGTITVSRLYADFAEDLTLVGKRHIFYREFVSHARGCSQYCATQGGQPATAGGHSDIYGRRTVSNIGIEDVLGYVGHQSADNYLGTSWYVLGSYSAGLHGVVGTKLIASEVNSTIGNRGSAPSKANG